MKTLVIGLGNPILTDDGVGVHAAREVARRLPPGTGVEVIELSTGGIALMEAMVGYEHCILIDAIWRPQDRAGEVLVFDAGCLPDTLNIASVHDADLPTALRLGRSLGAILPADDAIQIVAIAAREVLTFGEVPTPPVAAAIPHAAAHVLRLLGCDDTPRVPMLTSPLVIGGFNDIS
jgi:hydrogenase maturation protease